MAGDEVDKGTWGMVIVPISYTQSVLGSLKTTNEWEWYKRTKDESTMSREILNLVVSWSQGIEQHEQNAFSIYQFNAFKTFKICYADIIQNIQNIVTNTYQVWPM